MGKNGKLGKDYGKVVGKDAKGRPAWRGPGFVKKAPTKKTKEHNTEEQPLEPLVPLELQQLLLNTFRDSFPETLGSDTLTPTLQEIKNALYERDFTRAFGNDEFLEAYSVRWSPSRALCYQTILVDLQKHVAELALFCRKPRQRFESHAGDALLGASFDSTLHVVAFGGGAAEVVAFGGFLKYCYDVPAEIEDHDGSEGLSLLSLSNESLSSQSRPDSAVISPALNPELPSVALSQEPLIDLHLLDTATWDDVSQKLHHHLITPRPLSKYASVSAREANVPLIQGRDFKITFSQEDILSLGLQQLESIIGRKPSLVTLLFTLNELYTFSISKTTAFLLKLTTVVKSGTLLLVVDSPGSYSETTIGNGEESKKYPMHWLMDHFLLESNQKRGEEEDAKWKKVVEEDSKWFRMPESLRYPIPLESMRYQVHLYRRI